MSLKVIFLGTPDFSVPSLNILHDHQAIDLQAVVSNPSRPAGRGKSIQDPAVIEFAKKNKISFFQTHKINNDQELINHIKSLKPDLIIVLAFSQFLSKEVLEIPKIGCFNIHTSLLPKYRGAAPIQYAILNGDSSTGVSIQKMIKKMDAGDICLSRPVLIEKEETGGMLFTKLKFEAALALIEFINKIVDNSLTFTSQDESKVSFAPSLKKTDGALLFSKQKVSEVINKTKAFFPWPGSYTFLNNKRLKVFKVSKSSSTLKPGEVSNQFNTLNIGCIDGTIRLEVVQLEGKKKSTDSELLNGIKGEIKIEERIS